MSATAKRRRRRVKMSILLELFLMFFKIGLFTFGGGYAMISVIEYNCVEKKKWITHDEMMNVTVIAESTPGPIAINCSTYVGYAQGGFAGAVAATVGVVLPSFIIIYIISMFLDDFLEIARVANAFKGIKIAVGVLIVNAAVTMIRNMKKLKPRIFMVCAFAAMMLVNIFHWSFSSVAIMLVAAAVSLTIYLLSGGKTSKGGDAA